MSMLDAAPRAGGPVPQDRRSGRPSIVLLVTLLVALAVGAAASLLIGAATSSGTPPVPSSELIVSNTVLVVAILGFVGCLVLFIAVIAIFGRGRRGAALATRSVVNILVILLLATLFVVVARVYVGGGPTPSGGVPIGVNATGNSTGALPPPSQNTTNITSAGNLTPFLLPGVPGWVPYVLVAGVLLVVAVVAVPKVAEMLEDRRLARSPLLDRNRAPAEVRKVLEVAAGELESGADARAVIVRLYGDLLSRLRPMVGSVDPHTPEEIRSLHLERLGIRREASVRLTRLFEEARYSSHPLGAATLLEARTAIDAALADLARAWGTG